MRTHRKRATKHFIASGVLTVAALALSACSGGAGGGNGDFPEGPITVVVPYAAGSGPDATVRVITEVMAEDLGTEIIVENVEGGSSTIGLFEMSSAPADGYTIGYAGATGVAIQNRIIQTPFKGVESIEPVAQAVQVPNILAAGPNAPAKTIEELIKVAKERPGEVSVGIGDPASGQDLQVALLEKAAGIDLKQVYFGAGKNVLPAVNNTVDYTASQPGPLVQFQQKGELTFVGALSQNSPKGIEIESFNEAGYDVSAWNGWEGFFAPAGTPQAQLETLSEAIGKAIESEKFQKYAEGVYGIPFFVGHQEFQKVVEDTDKTGADLVTELKLADAVKK